MESVRLLLVDAYTLARRGIRVLLESCEIEVVAEAATAAAAVAALKARPCDLLLSGLVLPDLEAGEWIPWAWKLQGRVPALVLFDPGEEPAVMKAIRAGIQGCLSRAADEFELLRAVRQVASGGSYVDPGIAALILRELHGGDLDPVLAELSSREQQVLQCASLGMTNLQIARQLHFSESTVKSHFRVIYRKLKVPDRTQAILRALREGWISVPGLQPLKAGMGPP